MTAKGPGVIEPTRGGYVDASGHYVPERFPSDPYRLTDPASALSHYTDGSGEPRNYYLNSVDTSGLTASSFPAIKKAVDEGRPGTYTFDAAPGDKFDSGRPFDVHQSSAAATVGRLELQASGSLVIAQSGWYVFNGIIGVSKEFCRFPASTGRTWLAEFSTTVGRYLPGKDFRVYVVGTKPFIVSGHVVSQRAD